MANEGAYCDQLFNIESFTIIDGRDFSVFPCFPIDTMMRSLTIGADALTICTLPLVKKMRLVVGLVGDCREWQ